MAHRHRKHKAAGGREVYAGKGSKVEREAESTGEDFKRGGRKHHVGRAAGGRAKKSFARGGRAHSPFSHAASGIKGHRGFASPVTHEHGGHGEKHDAAATKGHPRHGHGGKAGHQYADGGRAKDDKEEEEGEECGMKKGGATLHYRGGKGAKPKKHADGGRTSGHWLQKKIAGHESEIHGKHHPGNAGAAHLDVERAKHGGRRAVGGAVSGNPGGQ